MSLGDYEIIGPLAYRGKAGCRSMTCTRMQGESDRCFGWHCSYCDEPCSSQGHQGCDVGDAVLGEAERVREERGR